MADQQWNRLYFDEWVAREGLDLIRGWKVDDVYSVPLKYWARTDGYAVQIQLEGTGELNAAYIQEIPPGQAPVPAAPPVRGARVRPRGRGSTSVWYREDRKSSFEWQAGSLFALPMNAHYQFFNGSGTEPARYVAVTTAPIMLNLLRNDDVVFDNDARFPSGSIARATISRATSRGIRSTVGTSRATLPSRISLPTSMDFPTTNPTAASARAASSSRSAMGCWGRTMRSSRVAPSRRCTAMGPAPTSSGCGATAIP